MTRMRSAGFVRAQVAAGTLAAALLATGCTDNSDSSEPGPVTTVTATAYQTVTPSPSPSETPTDGVDPTVAPFAAIVSIASLDVSGREVTLAGYVQGVAEEGGTCTFVATKVGTGTEVTAETMGIENQGTTSCGSAAVSSSSFSRGSWTVELRYESPSGSANSDAVALEIP